MTEDQVRMAKALGDCRFLPGSREKDFARSLAGWTARCPERQLSEKQAAWLGELFHRYRRQIGDQLHDQLCPICGRKTQ